MFVRVELPTTPSSHHFFRLQYESQLPRRCTNGQSSSFEACSLLSSQWQAVATHDPPFVLAIWKAFIRTSSDGGLYTFTMYKILLSAHENADTSLDQ